MSRKKQITFNLVASITSFVINLGIGFFLTPYIINSIGVEAYGFVSLGSNFINYASLITIALNSMAGRFITIEIYKNNWLGANKYFNSVLLANLILAGVMLVPSVFCVMYIDRIVNISPELVTDVKALFSFLFANYLVSIVASSFSVATFAANKLYLKSLRDIEGRCIRVIMLILLFWVFKPAVFYLGLSGFVVTVYTCIFDVYYTKKLLPKITLKKLYCNVNAVRELIVSGLWNTIIRVGQILLEGVDLLIANLFISSISMGKLALAKTLPTLIVSLVVVMTGVFVPDFTILYATKKTEDLVTSIKTSMKILGIVVNVPVAMLVVFGKELFMLWVPNQDYRVLHILSIISIITIVISGPINSIYCIFTVTNKLKTNAWILLSTGVINIIVVIILLSTTSYGVYIIAGVSTIMGIVRNLVFTVPFGAKYLGLKWTSFYPEVFKSVIGTMIIIAIGCCVNYIVSIESWGSLFVCGGITSIIGVVVNLILILNREERKFLLVRLAIGKEGKSKE